MKLLICSGIFPPESGGPATYSNTLADELSRRGHEVAVITYVDKKFKIHPPRRTKFKSTVQNPKFRIISIGRISPVKDYETLLKAVEILRDKGVVDIDVEIYGKIGLPEHQSYLDSLIEFVHGADLENIVKFQGEVVYEYLDETYHEADLFVNLSQTGSIDKAVLEAAASKVMLLTSNEAFKEPISQISPFLVFERNSPADLAEKILAITNLHALEKAKITDKLYTWVEKEHNLDNLTQRIIKEFQT